MMSGDLIALTTAFRGINVFSTVIFSVRNCSNSSICNDERFFCTSAEILAVSQGNRGAIQRTYFWRK